MQRSANSAFTRVLDALCGALPIRGSSIWLDPGSASRHYMPQRVRDARPAGSVRNASIL